MLSYFRGACHALAALLLLSGWALTPSVCEACNCCATAGGGLFTQSGETLDPGTFSLSANLIYTQFEYLSPDDIQSKTLSMTGDHVHLHAARWSLLETLKLTYGISNRLEFGLSTGLYRSEDVTEGHVHEDGTYEYHEFGDVVGTIDPWIRMKYQLFERSANFLAIEGGVKFPLGDDNVVPAAEDSNEPLEPSLQPGTGAFDFMLGAAFTRRFSTKTWWDASLHYLLRTENNHFKLGDALLFGTALSYNLVADLDRYPRASVSAEVNVWNLQQDQEDGEVVANSGGTTVFVTPGIKLVVSEQAAFRLAVGVPVLQDLNLEQQRAAIKLSGGVDFLF